MKRFLLSLIVSGVCVGAFAIPAKPGFINYTQPDGTVIKVRMVGDEYGHMTYSEKGHLVVEKDGALHYAIFDNQGVPQASDRIVTPMEPDAGEIALLQTSEQIEKWMETLESRKFSRLSKFSKSYRVVNSDDSEDSEDSDSEVSDDEGEGEENSDERRLVPLNFGRFETGFPAFGKIKGLVILVSYQDVDFKYGDYDYFFRMLNEEGFSDNGSFGSARDWFIENSSGQFLPDFDVYGPVQLPKNRAYYGGNNFVGDDKNPEKMVIHAMEILDDEVDFSQYDCDGDGVIDNVFIFYAGKGEHDSNLSSAVWPHSWEVYGGAGIEEYFDGLLLDRYACSCEYPSGYNRPDGIGTFVHEFSHVMGLPDLYATNYSSSFTPGDWSAMDSGPYNNDGLTPPNYSSFEKGALGWIDFIPLEEGAVEIPYLADTDVAYVLPTERPEEFFFFENRQQIGNDQFIPGHGMLVWHVDYKKSVWDMNTVNNKTGHNYVDLIEADNNKSRNTRSGDSFPGTKNVKEFSFSTKPQLASWAKKQLTLELSDIEESEDGLISFNAVATGVEYDPSAVKPVVADPMKDDIVYDLFGRRVSNPGKGIYIVNGKKTVR